MIFSYDVGLDLKQFFLLKTIRNKMVFFQINVLIHHLSNIIYCIELTKIECETIKNITSKKQFKINEEDI